VKAETVEVRQRIPFAMVEHTVLEDERLRVYDLAVYVALAKYANAGRECWPSMATIARTARCSERQARVSVRWLERCGHIASEARRERKGPKSNLYTLGGVGHNMPQGGAQYAPGVGHPVPPNYIHGNKNHLTPDPAFEAFWSEYPRKVNRAGAFKAWNARMHEIGDGGTFQTRAAEIMAAVRNYKVTVSGKELDYVMHPSTFIGPNMRWKDYVKLGPKRAEEVDPGKSMEWTCTACGRIQRHTAGHCVYCYAEKPTPAKTV
jgi:hypothetical protein